MTNIVKTPTKIHVKPGYIIVDSKWKTSSIYTELTSKFNRALLDNLDYYDFLVTDHKPVVYIPEAQLITDVRLDKYDRCSRNTVFITPRNTVTIESYSRLQDYLVISKGRSLIPVGDISELPLVLHSMSLAETTQTPNNSFKKHSDGSSDQCQINLLSTIPCLGKQKAQKLLDTFGTVYNIAFASKQDLGSVIGGASASKVHGFFNDRQT